MKRKHLIKIYVKGITNNFRKYSKYRITIVLKNFPTPIIYEYNVAHKHRDNDYPLLTGISKALAYVRAQKLDHVNIYISNERIYKELNYLSNVLISEHTKLTNECIRKYHKLKDKYKLNIVYEKETP